MKTKPFNLEEALNGAKVVTRDGREVTQLTFFETKSPFPLIGVYDNGLMSSWRKNGKHIADTVVTDGDLFIAIEPKRIYINMYSYGYDTWISNEIFYSKEEAKKYSRNYYLKTIEITDEL